MSRTFRISLIVISIAVGAPALIWGMRAGLGAVSSSLNTQPNTRITELVKALLEKLKQDAIAYEITSIERSTATVTVLGPVTTEYLQGLAPFLGDHEIRLEVKTGR